MMSPIYEARRLPIVMSPEDIRRLIDATSSLKYKAALSVAYGAGMRIAEVANLRVNGIDRQRMLIHVELGKGNQDRNAMLSPTLLIVLREWWHYAQAEHKMLKGGWLFPGQDPVNHISTRQISRDCRAAVTIAGLDQRVSMHTLRTVLQPTYWSRSRNSFAAGVSKVRRLPVFGRVILRRNACSPMRGPSVP